MPRFRFKLLQIDDLHIVLLPKLNAAQMVEVRARFASKGFDVTGDRKIVARRRGENIRLTDEGVCWSESDPTDALAPVIPGLMGMSKEPVLLEAILERYFDLKRNGRGALVRFKPRIEAWHFWDVLREKSDCGLTPDERAMVCFILGSSGGRVRMLTDFPVEGSAVRRFGRVQYYSSSISSKEAAATLRTNGTRGTKNSYLPKDGKMNLASFTLPSRTEQTQLVRSLGEWCCLTPL